MSGFGHNKITSNKRNFETQNPTKQIEIHQSPITNNDPLK